MRIPWFRSRRRTPRATALTFIPRAKTRVLTPAPAGGPHYWRMCEHCQTAQATVYCRSHVRFYCTDCAWSHDQAGQCSLLSYQAARAISQEILCSLRS